MRTDSKLLKRDLLKGLGDLKKLGTEIGGDLRTASAGARSGLKRFLAPKIANMEKLAKDVGATSHDAVARTSAAFGAFRAPVKAGQPARPTKARTTKKKSAPRKVSRRTPAKGKR
jgi:hypothetical protein